MPTAKHFTTLLAAMNAFDADDLCGDIDMLADGAKPATVAFGAAATAALRTAEIVETATDFRANLEEAITALSGIKAAAQLEARIERFLARCKDLSR